MLPVARGGAIPSETSDVRIEVTGFMIDGEKAELVYTFGFTEKNRKTPLRVVVEDVTESDAVLLVTDQFPGLGSDGYWKGTSSGLKAGDISLLWLYRPGDTEKVFRFTITLSDGRTEEIYQASIWPSEAKPLVKQALRI